MPQMEFLYRCIEQTMERVLPEEAAFLESHDAARAEVNRLVD